MSEIDEADVIKLLGVRGPMRDFRLFVGREAELSVLDGVSQFPHNCAWIYGAPKNGKSSLSLYVARRAEENRKRVKYVNAGDVAPTDFQGLLRRVVFGERSRGGPTDIVETSFTAMASKTEAEPLLVIFDNFDGHALNFRLEQQYFLRSKNQTYPNLNYLFVTRLNPNRIVEDVADEGSRLLGICSQVQIPILASHDVKQLCRLVAETFGLDCYREWATEVLSKVGGNPSSVVEALSHLVTGVANKWQVQRTPQRMELPDTVARETLRSHWKGLPAASRMFLLGNVDKGPEKESAVREGYWDERRDEAIRPTHLIALGKTLGVRLFDTPTSAQAGTGLAQIGELHQTVMIVNVVANRCGDEDVFHVTTEALNWAIVSRPITSENALHVVVEHLAKFLYEGARRRRPGALADESEWRIKDVALAREYKNSTGMKMLTCLRHYYDHSPHKPAAAVQREVEVGDWFEQACGARAPTTQEHFAAIVSFVVGQLTEAVRTLQRGIAARANNGDLGDAELG